MSQTVGSGSLEQGIQTAREGHRLLARLHLEQAAQEDPHNADAWMWLAWVADSPADALEHIQRAIEATPHDAAAIAGLQWVGSLCGKSVDELQPEAAEVIEESDADDVRFDTLEIQVDVESLQRRLPDLDGEDTNDTYEWSVDELLDSGEIEWVELNPDEMNKILELEEEPVVLEVADDEPFEDFEVAEVIVDEPEIISETPTEEVEESKPPRVLLLDASPTFRQLASLALRRAGYEVETTDDELYALEHLADIEPSVILVDSSTPNVGGYQLCKLIKKHTETRHIPVLLLSSEDKLFDRMRGRLSGCAGSLAKPVSWDNLIKKIERHVAVS